MSLTVQFQTIAFMSLCGVLMGIGFDTYQVFKGKGRIPRWLIFLLDLSFWLCSIWLVFFVLVRVNDGVVRLPIFLGILAGAYVYFVLVSKKYIQLLLIVIKFCKWCYRTTLLLFHVLIISPVRFIVRLIWILLTFIFSILLAIGNFLWRIIRFLTAPFVNWGRKIGKGFSRTKTGFWNRMKNWFKPKPKK
ncbi:spore cortex biosynthesis protein YabQ [Brevibacillus sp. B_LB10_24]|uniref:spore cortex biosynthesis protein YabQ n=1 Tax=Brevibacillus sp. B_LB10_24 TaxID=3380645 RepID=UPI0038BD51FA